MVKQIKYGILLEVFGKNVGIIRDVERVLKRVGRLAKGGLFGTGGFKGALGGLGLGGLVSGGLFGGLIGAAKAAIGGVVGVFRAGIGAVVGIVRAGINIAGGIIRTGIGLVKKAGLLGLGIGAVIGWQLVKGIRENMQLADVRQVLQKLIGGAAKAAEDYARKLSLRTPFTPMQMLLGTAGLETVGLKVQRYLEPIADWAAGAKVPLQQIIELMQRAKTGQFGESMEAARRALISRRDLERQGATFNAGGAYQGTPERFVAQLIAAAQARFGGMAAKAAEVGSGPLSTFKGVIQDIRDTLSEPWYDRFNNALKDLNGWLLKINGSGGMQSLARWSERAATAIDHGIRRALEWISSRQWSFDNITQGFANLWKTLVTYRDDLLHLFAFKDADNKLHMGPLVDVAVGAFHYIAAEVEDIFNALWVNVGDRLLSALLNALANAGRAVNERIMAAQDERGRRSYATAQRGQGNITPWSALPEHVKAGWIEGNTTIAQRQSEKYAMGLASFIEDLAAGRPEKTPKQRAAEAAAAQVETSKERAAARAQMQRGWDAARASAGPPLEQAGHDVAGILPPKPGAAAPPAPTPQEQAEQDPRVQRMGQAIMEKRRVAQMLSSQGYVEQAQGLLKESDELERKMNGLIETMARTVNDTRAGLQSLRGRMDRAERTLRALSTGRP